MLFHARPGDAVFTTCLRLFRHYPLAVRRHYAEHRYGSMVLVNRDAGTARFFVLIMEWDDLFVLRHWDRRDGARVEIRPNEPASGEVRRVIEASVPVPRDGALLGWVDGVQVQAVLAAYGRLAEPWDDASAVPGVMVMPRAGSQPAEWPPLAANPLDDGQLWGYIEQRQVADLSPLVTCRAGCAFWVPGSDSGAGRPVGARVVVTERLSTEEFWLPAGVYADHWTLREGTPALTARQLLALPGVVDLAGGRGQHLLGVLLPISSGRRLAELLRFPCTHQRGESPWPVWSSSPTITQTAAATTGTNSSSTAVGVVTATPRRSSTR